MKKLCLLFVLLACFSFLTFAQANEQEELDFLLFQPNSGNLFANQEQAMTHLDNLAKYLTGKNLNPGQIFVYGYAAAAVNDIEPLNLSRDRALCVINELQRRGVSENLFSEPVAYGSVDLWGGNTNEEDRIPNRRVRILLDGAFLTPTALKAAEHEIKISSADNDEATDQNIKSEDSTYSKGQETRKGKNISTFLKYLLLLLVFIAIIAAILLTRPRRGKNMDGHAVQETPNEEIQATAPVAANQTTVNLDEEIRRRSYELYLEKGAWNGDADGDWYKAVQEISARYEAQDYNVYTADESWWAKK
jgi:hypothetical protein